MRASKAANPNASNTILLHGGQYRLTKPVVFTPEDSGAPGKPLVIAAAPGEAPVLSSATPISGWKLADAATPNLAKEAQGKVFQAVIDAGVMSVMPGHFTLVRDRKHALPLNPAKDKRILLVGIVPASRKGGDGGFSRLNHMKKELESRGFTVDLQHNILYETDYWQSDLTERYDRIIVIPIRSMHQPYGPLLFWDDEAQSVWGINAMPQTCIILAASTVALSAITAHSASAALPPFASSRATLRLRKAADESLDRAESGQMADAAAWGGRERLVNHPGFCEVTRVMDGHGADSSEDFVRLLIEYQQPLRVFIRALMPGQMEAWDVFQQTNAVLWRKKAAFTAGTDFRAWAFKVARFEVLSFLQRKRRQGWLLFESDMVDLMEQEIPGDAIELEHRIQALESCMSGLKPHDRELIKRRYLAQGSLEDYARQLGRTVGTLKTRLFRLRAVLRQCINRKMAEEGLA